MKYCIYLKSGEENLSFSSQEHVFPAGLGGISKLPFGFVSDEFNNSISKIEEDFIRNSIISIPRTFIGPGKRGSLSKSKSTKSLISLIQINNDVSLGYVSLGTPYIISQIKITNNQYTIEINPKELINLDDFLLKLDSPKKINIIDKAINKNTIIIGLWKNKLYHAKHPESDFEYNTDTIKNSIKQNLNLSNTTYKESFVTVTQNIKHSILSEEIVIAKICFNFLASIIPHSLIIDNSLDKIRNLIVNCIHSTQISRINTKKLFPLKLPKDAHSIIILPENHNLKFIIIFYGGLLSYQIIFENLNTEIVNIIRDNLYGLIIDWKNRKEYHLIDYINLNMNKIIY